MNQTLIILHNYASLQCSLQGIWCLKSLKYNYFKSKIDLTIYLHALCIILESNMVMNDLIMLYDL